MPLLSLSPETCAFVFAFLFAPLTLSPISPFATEIEDQEDLSAAGVGQPVTLISKPGNPGEALKSEKGEETAVHQRHSSKESSGISLLPPVPGCGPVATTTDESDDNEVSQQVKLGDRYCSECEIQFKSFKTFKVHKQLYCGSRHAASKIMFSSSPPTPPAASATTVRSRSSQKQSSPSLNNACNNNTHNHQRNNVNKAATRCPESEAASQRPLGPDVVTAMTHLVDGHQAGTSAMLPLQVLSPGSPGQSAPLALMSPSLLLNQPIFVAISTNPLILVPCSYNAATGGLNFAGSAQPVLPAVSMSSQHAAAFSNPVPAQRHSKGSRTLSPHSSSPNHTVGNDGAISPVAADGDQPLDLTSKAVAGTVKDNSTLEQVVKNITLANQHNGSATCSETANSRIERRRNSNAIVIAPGSSFLNKPPHHSSYSQIHDHDTTTDDNNSRSSCCSPPQVHSLSLPIAGLPAPGGLANGVLGPAAGTMASAAAGSMERHALVKQGTFRCKDCNIVFLKHENFLVHKSMYCASRRSSDLNNVSSPSPDPPESDHAPNSSPDITIDSKPIPVPSPSRSVTSTPPHGSPPPLTQHHPPVFQYFCVACGIRFTSLDTLHAHQAFYCLKRSVSSQAAKNSSLENGSTSNGCDTKSCPEDSCDRVVPAAAALPPVASLKSCHSQSNLQAFKCTICGYKGHTMRGMRTHVRIHQDKMQGLSEESFIEYMDDAAAERRTATTGPGSRSRRRSLEPAAAAHDRQSPSTKRRRPAIPSLRYN